MPKSNKKTTQCLIYKIFYSSICAITLIATILSFVLYLNHYDSDLALFDKGISLSVYNCISVFVFVFCIFILIYKKLFSLAKSSLPEYSLPVIFSSSFCGFFTIAYPVVLMFEKLESGAGVGIVSLFVCIFGVISSLYFFWQIFNGSSGAKYLSIFGMLFVVFCILIIFTVHYTSKEVLLTSPLRVGSLLSFVSIMLFIMSEVRFHIYTPSLPMYFSFGFAAMFYGISGALPKLVLSLLSMQKFEFSSITVLYSIEVFCGIYACVRLSHYLKSGSFKMSSIEGFLSFIEKYSQPISEEEALEYDLVEKSSVSEETTAIINEPTVENSTENEDINTEPQEEETKTETVEEEKIEEDHENSEKEESFENELPDDVGFVGGNEGEFQLDDYDSADDISDDDFDDDTVPFENTGIEDSIKEAMDDTSEDLGAVIDYEQIRNETLDDVMKSEHLYAMLADTVNIFEKDEDDEDDDDIDEDVMQVLGEIKNSNSTVNKKQDVDKSKSRFRFVKKM